MQTRDSDTTSGDGETQVRGQSGELENTERRGQETYQQRVHGAEVFAGVEVSPQNVLH